MDLLVDIGNSCIKWALRTDQLTGHQNCNYEKEKLAEALDEHWSDLPEPSRIVVSNVGGNLIREQLDGWVLHTWNLHPEYARVSKTAFGVRNAYDDVTEYGIDRWMAVIAAWNKHHSPACIVDCGSAVTIDSLGRGGLHKGGLIFPGIRMMQQSLFSRTADIPASQCEASAELATSTRQAVANGCTMAVVALIDRIMAEMQEIEGTDTLCLLTGGDAAHIGRFLNATYSHEPSLVLEGLALYADERQ